LAARSRSVDGCSRSGPPTSLKLNEKGGWEHIVLPVEDFFKKMGMPEALDIVTRYETWDGVQESQRHQKRHRPGPSLCC
jgi:hypothetical protein